MEHLSDDWIEALADAARSREAPDPDPLAEVALTIEQVVPDVRTWRLVIDHGRVAVEDGPGTHDVRLTTDAATAADIAAGQRSALDAFSTGRLRLGGDVSALLEHGPALAVLGDLFGRVRTDTFGAEA